MQPLPFTDSQYGRILDHIVVACVDTAITYRGQVFLVKRDLEPAKDAWWLFGGRINKGESLQEAAQRGILRELGLHVTQDRFNEVGSFNLRWAIRREEPVTNGCHHLLIAHQVEITEQEKEELDRRYGSDQRYTWIDYPDVQRSDLLLELAAIMHKLQSVVHGTP